MNRFVDTDLDWLGEEETPAEEKSIKEKGRFIQDPTTGLLMGSEPGPDEGGSGGEGGGGGEAHTSMGSKGEGGGKVKGISDFQKDDVGVYYTVARDQDAQKVFLDTWNKYVDKTPSEFKKEFFGNNAVKGEMTVGSHPQYSADTIMVKTTLRNDDGDEIGQMDATIFPADNRVHMDYYKLDSSEQAHGVMKSVMSHEMKMWEDMGVTKVDLLANLEVGGYAWARYGFEPTRQAWRSLSQELRNQIDDMSEGGGGGGGRAGSWNSMSDARQSRIESAFYADTHEEFYDSEITSWRESGEPLESAKVEVVSDFNSGTNAGTDWAVETVKAHLQGQQDIGKPWPFMAENIVDAIKLDYSSRSGDGSGDLEVTFNDDLLAPVGVDLSDTLPGIPKMEPHEYLTEQMREDITKALEWQFDSTAERAADDIDPPDHLADSAQEQQRDYWDQMDDSDRYAWAERHRSDMLVHDDGSPGDGTGEIPKDEADSLKLLTLNSDPKSLWAIADSKWGKRLLIEKDWNGHMEMDNSDHTGRFHAYVEKAKK